MNSFKQTTGRDIAVGTEVAVRRLGKLSLLAVSLGVAFGSAPALAEPMLHSVAFYRNSDMSRWTDNYVEFGALYNTKDSYKFGEWSGLRDDGVNGVVGLNWISRDRGNDAAYWSLNASGLGLETRKFAAESGIQGRWKVNFGADRLVRSEIDSARFIHQGLGSSNLTLTANCRPPFTGTNVGATPVSSRPECFSGYKIEQGRDFYRLGMSAALPGGWDASINYREDVRDGTRVTGIYNSFLNTGNNTSSTGFTNAALNVPYEINDRTQQLEAQLAYADKLAQLQFAYSYSRYDNELNSFSVANPLHDSQIGRMSLMPSNEFHQLTATGAYSLTRDTRVTTKLSYGIGTQDQAFLPYTSLGATAVALPRASLDGEVVKTLFDLTLTTRPSDKSTVKLGYQYYDYDNRTPLAQYLYASRDGAQPTLPLAATGSANVRSNAPLSTTENKAVLDGDYQLGGQAVLRGLVEYKQVKYALTDRSETETTKAGVELRKPVMGNFMGSVGYTYTERTGSAYDKNTFFRNSYTDPNYQVNANGGSLTNHPSLRAFMYSDYDEDRVRATGNWTLSETVALNTSIDGYRQVFKGPNCGTIIDPNAAAAINKAVSDASQKVPDSCLGRTLAEGGSLNLDLQWQPEENLGAYAFYTVAQTAHQQRGRTWRTDGSGNVVAGTTDESFSAADTRRDWFGHLVNLDQTLGIGAKWQPTEVWDLGGQYVFSHAVSKTDIQQNAAPSVSNATPTGNAGALSATTALPDAETTVQAVQIYAKWNFNRKTTFRVNYLYETMKSSNFAYDGLTPTSASGVLLTGQGSPKYENHVIGVSVAVNSW